MHLHLALMASSLLSGFGGGLGPIPGEERFTSAATQTPNAAGAALGWGAIGEDQYLTITPRLELNLGIVGVGIQAPLNLRVIDNPPEATEDDYYGLLRREDWDQPTDFLKILRYVRVGHKGDLFYARVGELAAEIGHGTIMSRYMNNMNPDTFRVGAELAVDTDYGGGEVMVGDFGAVFAEGVGSRIMGARFYVKPVQFVMPDSLLNIFSVGVTVVSDMNAPRTIATEPDPNDPAGTVFQLDETGTNLLPGSDRAQTVYGFDLEAEVLRSAMLDVIPYTDLNFIDGAGWGWHLGTLVTAKMPIGFDLQIPLRVEYRRFKSNYRPTYFSTFYEIERYSYRDVAPKPDALGPKSEVVRDLSGDGGKNGYYADLAFDFAGLVQIGAVYEDYDGPDNGTVAGFLNVPALEVIQLKAYYTRTQVEGTEDIFKLDDRSMAVAEGRYQLVTFVYLVGRWTRTWQLQNDPNDRDYGEYESTDSWNAGLEVSFTF